MLLRLAATDVGSVENLTDITTHPFTPLTHILRFRRSPKLWVCPLASVIC